MRLELLKDIAEIIAGQSPPSESYNKSGEGIPFFQGMADYGEKFPVIRNWCLKPTKISQPKDILISVRAPVGPVNINNVEACIGRGLSAIRAKKNYYYEYIYYFLKANTLQIANLGVGSTFTAITQKDLGHVKVPVPEPLLDQIKIATLLGKAEELVKQRKESIDLLDEFLKSTFSKMFGDPIRNEKRWSLDSLGETTLKITDGEHLSPALVQRGFHLIMAKDVLDDRVDFTQNNFVSESDFKKFTKKCNPENGDVLLVSRGATIGRCVVVNADRPFCLMGSVILIKADESKLDGTFINHLFKNDSFFRRLIITSGSSAQQAIYIAGLKKVKTIAPPIEIQKEFKAIVEKVDAIQVQFKNSLSELENLFASLSQRAFKGELDLSTVRIDQSSLKSFEQTEKQPKDTGRVKIQEALDAAASISKHFEKVTDLSKAVNRFNIYFESWNKLNVQLKALPKLPEAVIKAQKNVALIQKAFGNIPAIPKSKAIITWGSVSSEQIANLIKEQYSGFYFTSEMMTRFLTDEHVIFPAYYSSEELKKNPKANDSDDFKTFIFSALNNENPFLKLEQVFYNAETDNINLSLREEDFELVKERIKNDRTGVYLRIVE